MRMTSRWVIPKFLDLRYDDRISFGGWHPWLGVHCYLLGGCCGGDLENY